MKKTLFIAGLALIGTLAFSQDHFNVGDTGPAGGIIFYDKGEFSNGWRYLEAAPAEAEFNAQWGAYTGNGNNYKGRDISGTGTETGSGKQNTELIIKGLKQWKEGGRAAQLCTYLNTGGYKDWFLPSKDELSLMYQNLKQKGLGGFSNNWYWTSSQYDINYTWHQKFNNGQQQTSYYRSGMAAVRAIRAF
jgi:hypothetical protein